MDVLEIECPVCGAAPSWKCFNERGQKSRPSPHVARVYMAAERLLKKDAARGQGSGQRTPSDLAAASGVASPAAPDANPLALSPTNLWREHMGLAYEDDEPIEQSWWDQMEEADAREESEHGPA